MRVASSSALLPVVPRPARDERLSSWLTRLARFYAMPIDVFLECCGLNCPDVSALEWRLGEGEGAVLASRTGMTVEVLRTMTFAEFAPHARLMVAADSRHVCPYCPPDIHRKGAAFPGPSGVASTMLGSRRAAVEGWRRGCRKRFSRCSISPRVTVRCG